MLETFFGEREFVLRIFDGTCADVILLGWAGDTFQLIPAHDQEKSCTSFLLNLEMLNNRAPTTKFYKLILA